MKQTDQNSAIPIQNRFIKSIENRIKNRIQIPFIIELWDGRVYPFGKGDPCFKIRAKNRAALLALSSLDELLIGEAYINQAIDFEGDMLSLVAMRGTLSDPHPLLRLWRLVVPFFTRRQTRDRKAIATHYDYDSDFYLSFMDPSRTYSQAVFRHDGESLETAQNHKLEFALESCNLRSGDRVLDVGGGWGSFVEFAGKKGIEVTSLTISEKSEIFIKRLIEIYNLPCRVLNFDFLSYHEETKYDAIVVLGVMEHLPDYPAVIKQFSRLLKPKGRIYLDASATNRKYDSPVFITKHVFPGGHSFFCLHEFLAAVAQSDLEVICVQNDRKNYMLTCKAWAQKLDNINEEVILRWGEHLYRLFRIYLWGSVYGFQSHELSAHRVILEKY